MVTPDIGSSAKAGEVGHDILGRATSLDVFFRPETIAVIGATETAGSVGRTLLWNLLTNPFGGTVFPVNPKRPSVLGVKSYPSIQDVPAQVDLAVIVTPAPAVPAVVVQCVAANVRGVIIISAGFAEAGPEGERLLAQIRASIAGSNIRVIGPNCLGVMSPLTGLNATFAASMAYPGSVGFISQSGALLTAILDWSLQEKVGFSAFVSVGSMVDVGWGDLIDYLGDDPRTQSIVIYMESIGDARSFLSAAREVALRKPIIVIKAGRSEAAAKAAASHTGSLAGSDEVLDAAFRRVGVLRVQQISDLFYMSEVLAKQPRPKGPRLTVVTNAGGPGVLATDALIAGGGKLAELSSETVAALNAHLPQHWSHGNPIDILGDAGPDRYAQAVKTVAVDPESDGLLVILTPQAMTDPTRTADQLGAFAKTAGKPILTSWMGGAGVAAGRTILNGAAIPSFPYPDTAVRVFNYMWRSSYNLQGIYETPAVQAESDGEVDVRQAADLITSVRDSGRTLLTEFESKQLLAAYGIPTVETRIAETEEVAVTAANALGYPVVLKIYSTTITHKTDVGGVRLNLADASDVRQAFRLIRDAVSKKAGSEHFGGVTVQPMIRLDGYELILGSSVDPQFGPVLLFGAGGQLVEVFHDHALALPPLNTTLARRMMEQTKVWKALQGVRGRASIDLAALEQLMVRLGRLVVEQRWIKEIDINPLLASPERLLALDARVVLHGPEVTEEQLPKLAIRPYPAQYIRGWTMPSGQSVTIRPIAPEDEPLLVQFHETLSEQSVYSRYFQNLKLGQRVAHERLARLCFIDYDREMALVADRRSPQGQHEMIGIGRLIRLRGAPQAEFSLLISDRVQRQGLGAEILSRLIQIGRDEGLQAIRADILADNAGMLRLCAKLGFQITPELGEPTLRAILYLT